MSVTVLATGRTTGTALPAERAYPVYSGKLTALDGWLGAFEVAWTQENPIDLDLCTRCNACLRACPEKAIDESYQVDLDRCKDHRACVAACGAVGAIDFARKDTARSERFDLVLDLHDEPRGSRSTSRRRAISVRAPTRSRRPRRSPSSPTLTGEFEKPKFFSYKASLCAHSRSRTTGLHAMHRRVLGARDPAGRRSHRGRAASVRRLRRVHDRVPVGRADVRVPVRCPISPRASGRCSRPTRRAGGRDACLLFHAEDAPRRDRAHGAPRRGLPARVIPIEVQHIASVGVDVWLAALAWGASQVAVLATGSEAPQYRDALAFQMRVADTIAQRARLPGRALPLVDADALDALAQWTPALRTARRRRRSRRRRKSARPPALAIEHLAAHAPMPQSVIPLPAGSPYGAITINKDTCTMCLACVGSCPEAAILDNLEAPQVRFIETKCVQCGICAATCPEHAITLVPRLDLDAGGAAPRVLNEAAIVKCVTLRQAARHAEDDRDDARQARGPFDVRRAGVARSPQDVRRLPGGRPHQEREQRRHPRPLTMEISAVTLHHALAPEDQARAEFYALQARLYAAPPDAPTLALIGASEPWADAGGNPLAAPGTDSSSRAGRWTPRPPSRSTPISSSAWASSEVDLHASHWIVEGAAERPLVGVRADLARLGLGRQAGLDAVRRPPGGSLRNDAHSHCRGRRPASGARSRSQRAFFERRIAPWVFDCCNAIRQAQLPITTGG